MFYDFDYYKLDVWVRCHVSKIPQAVLPVTVHKQFDSTPYTIPAKTDLTAKTVLCIQGSTELQRMSTKGRMLWWKAPRLEIVEDMARSAGVKVGIAAHLVPDGTVVQRIRGTRDYTVDRQLSGLGVTGTHMQWMAGSGTPLILPESPSQKRTLCILPHDGMVQLPPKTALTIIYKYLFDNHPSK